MTKLMMKKKKDAPKINFCASELESLNHGDKTYVKRRFLVIFHHKFCLETFGWKHVHTPPDVWCNLGDILSTSTCFLV
jgi:hypothetical protein